MLVTTFDQLFTAGTGGWLIHGSVYKRVYMAISQTHNRITN